MSKNSQNSRLVIGEKQGVSIYKENPSVPNAITSNKRRRVQGISGSALMAHLLLYCRHSKQNTLCELLYSQ
jgi:hypothetical protein